jgi:hypothetical protein
MSRNLHTIVDDFNLSHLPKTAENRVGQGLLPKTHKSVSRRGSSIVWFAGNSILVSLQNQRNTASNERPGVSRGSALRSLIGVVGAEKIGGWRARNGNAARGRTPERNRGGERANSDVSRYPRNQFDKWPAGK